MALKKGKEKNEGSNERKMKVGRKGAGSLNALEVKFPGGEGASNNGGGTATMAARPFLCTPVMGSGNWQSAENPDTWKTAHEGHSPKGEQTGNEERARQR